MERTATIFTTPRQARKAIGFLNNRCLLARIEGEGEDTSVVLIVPPHITSEKARDILERAVEV